MATPSNIRIRLSACIALITSLFGLVPAQAVFAKPPAAPSAVLGPALPGAATNQASIQVTLSQPLYYISPEPRMPQDIVAMAAVRNWPAGAPKPTTFTWHVYLDWAFPPYPTRHTIDTKTYVHPSPWKIDLGPEIRGGTLTVVAKAMLNGQEVVGQANAPVLGQNPAREAILSRFPPNRFGLIASKIGMAESDLRQFDPVTGLPELSRTYDVGIMQLNAPSGSITSADQVWDWRANVRRGLEMLQGKRQITVLASRHAVDLHRVPEESEPAYQTMACLNCVRALLGLPALTPPSVPPLSVAPGSGMLPYEPDPDHLGLSQVEREAIRRYNGGREYAFVVTPNPFTLGFDSTRWQVDPSRGGVRPTSGDPNYVHNVLLARSGFVLPKPVVAVHGGHSKKSARRRHHRRHAG